MAKRNRNKRKKAQQEPDVDSQMIEAFMQMDEGGSAPQEEPGEEPETESEETENPESEEVESEEDKDPEAEESEESEEESEEDPESEEESEEEEEESEEEELPTYNIRGKEYTLDQLITEGVIDDIATQANQVAHFQELYEKTKAEAEELKKSQEQQKAVQAQPQPQAPTYTPEQIQAHIRPQIEAAVKEGWIDQDFAELYPRAAASQMFVYQDYTALKQLVAQMYQFMQQSSARDARGSMESTLDGICEQLVNLHDVYKPLADKDARSKFYEYLATKVNPRVDAISQELLEEQYLAFQREAILTAIRSKEGQLPPKKQGKKGGKKPRTKRKLAVGEAGNARKGSKRTAQQQQTVDEAMIASFMESYST